jgi:hypothetical protein
MKIFLEIEVDGQERDAVLKLLRDNGYAVRDVPVEASRHADI